MLSKFEANGHEVEFSSLDKIYFPESGLTKGQILDYYRRVAPLMLPYLKERPVTLHRFPEGIGGEGFYQKQVPDYFPSWIPTVTVEKRTDGKSQDLVLVNNTETLLYLVNQGCLVFHPWLSRVDRLEEPDRAVIDLDPSGCEPDKIREAAQKVYGRLAPHHSLYVTTTGSTGYHLVLPLRRGSTFEEVREQLRVIAEALVSEFPDELTTQHRKSEREGRVYLDIARNAYAQTSVAIYSVRARQGAPIATPIEKDELKRTDLTPTTYRLENIFRRLGQKEDPWARLWAQPRQKGLNNLLERLT